MYVYMSFVIMLVLCDVPLSHVTSEPLQSDFERHVRLLKDRFLSDLEIVVEDVEFHAHFFVFGAFVLLRSF